MNSAFSEQVGKVYIVTHGMRQCLICNLLFTREEAPKHAGTTCFPKQRSSESTVHDVWSAFTGHKKLED
jgi:hypothetical protein